MVMKMDKPRASVIVLNWNGKHFLEKCLDSLLNQDYTNFEVLLVDNGSTDGSVEFVKEKFGKNTNLKVMALKKNSHRLKSLHWTRIMALQVVTIEGQR